MATEAAHLVDIEEIRQLKARYFRTLDQNDWDGYRDVFTEDVAIDTRDDSGEFGLFDARQPYLDMLQPILKGSTTVHHGHMSEIRITGADTAEGVWSMEDQVRFSEASGMGILLGSGWYEEQYRRVDGEWKIAAMKLRRQRVEMNGQQTFPRADVEID